MSRILTRFKCEMVRHTINSILAPTNALYLFAGVPGFDAGLANEERDSTFDAFNEPWRQMLFGVKVAPSAVAFMTRRYDWEHAKVFAQYDHNPSEIGRAELNDSRFYVLVDEQHVYKCISNNNRSPTTVKPTSLDKGRPVEYADGYVWMYLYEITNPQKVQFLTIDFMPVFEDTTTKTAALPGAIFKIDIVNGGTDYPFHRGTANFVTGATTGQTLTLIKDSTIQLRQAAFVANYFQNCAITLTDANGQQDIVTIVSSSAVGDSIQVHLARPVSGIAIANGIQFSIAPRIQVGGSTGLSFQQFDSDGLNRRDDSVNAVAYAEVNPLNGAISKVTMVNPGTEYTEADVRAISGIGFGAGASLRAVLSPPGGHGADVFTELFAINLGISVRLDNSAIPSNISYSQIGLLNNPRLRINPAVLYTQPTFNMIAELSVDAVGTSLPFVAGEVVYAAGSSKRATVAYANNTTVGVIGIAGSDRSPLTNDQFRVGEALTTLSGSKQFTVAAITRTPDLRIFDGDVQYIQNLLPIDRTITSPEIVKIVIRFGT